MPKRKDLNMTDEARAFLARIFRAAAEKCEPSTKEDRAETRSGGTGRPPPSPPGP